MKASELRIGNWASVSGKIESVVLEIGEKMIHLQGNFLMNYAKDVYPIPLTEEWLLKFGFKKKDNYFDFENYSFKDGMLYWSGGICSTCDLISHLVIRYVHQLQNIYFALTGEELTIQS